MAKLTVVEGRKSSLYNHFEEYELVSCRATDTRLMGVVALKLSWQDSSNSQKRYYQIIHLDYSEYGIDEYLEFECLPEDPAYRDIRAKVQERWNHFIKVMGGSALSITAECALRLIDSALSLAADDVEREFDSEDNKRFRSLATRRIALMRETLESRGISSDSCSTEDAIDAVSVAGLGSYGTINYFLMRLLDRDFDAASYLSAIPRDELEKSPLATNGIQSLMRSDISDVPKRFNPRADERLNMYNCRITSLSRDGYYHMSLSIWLDESRKSQRALVAGMEIGTSALLSDYEAAIQVAQSEYITLFGFDRERLSEIDPGDIGLFSGAERSVCENGILYTIYNETNEHVESSSYRLSDDVYGYALFSLMGELILMSPDLDRISSMDERITMSIISPHLTIKGRYKMENPIFHTLCHAAGISFDDLIDTDY